MNVKLSVTGDKQIDRLFKAWPRDLQHQTLGTAHASAAKPLVEKAKLLAPEGPTGNLVDSIGLVKTPVAKANNIGEVIVGPRRSRRFRGFAGHLVEFGTRPRRNKKGANRGVMPKTPFMQPAFIATSAAVINRISTELARKMYSTMKRYL
jgi:hypothetical protein